MVNHAFAVAETQIGLALETTPGTPVAPAFYLPVRAPKYKPDLMLITDNTLQGSMVGVYDQVPGLRYDSHGWDSYPYLDSFGALLRCELGSPDNLVAAPANTTLAAAAAAGAMSISATASIAAGSWIVIGSGGTVETHQTNAVSGVGPYTVTLDYPLNYAQASGVTVTGLTAHQFSLLNNAGAGNQPPTATISDFDGDQWRQLAGCQLDKLTLKGAATALADYTCTWFGQAATTPAAPVPSYTTTQAPPAWTTRASIGGTQIGTIVDWEWDFGRGVKPIPALTGSQEYFMFFAGVLTSSGKLTVIEEAGAPQISSYLAGARESLDITVSDVRSGYALKLHSSLMMFKTAELDRGAEWVQAVLEFESLPTATDALAGGVSPVLATLANAQTAAY